MIIVAAMWSWQSLRAAPAASIATVEMVHGRCGGCERPFQLGELQFLDVLEGWAVGSAVSVFTGHISQYSSILHTTAGGSTCAALKSVDAYGVAVDPAF